ncbi:serine/threonine protein kinase [Kribbella sp. NPDC056345]|uniref:serine/threonine protein kinase n=1 Tax=Kribbella sp. NPDC056345 TaxID=3345789 RepID=UPI0035D5E1A1
MAEIAPDSLIPRATGPVARIFLMPPRDSGPPTIVKVYPRGLDRRTFNAVEVEQAKLAGLRVASSVLLADGVEELPDGRTGVRMEFCPQSLVELAGGRGLPIGDVVVLGQILGSVLAEAHEGGLVHGGVTPSNVLERPNGQPVLADFGMALRLRFPRDLTGAAAYTAPEVLRDGELSEEADVYGLGAVLYLALTGQSPFPTRPGETPDDVVLRVLREPAPEVSGRDVPPALTALLRRMLAKDAGTRPDAAAVVREFETLLRGTTDAADELDFDDFRDELAAGRSVPVATASAQRARRQWKAPRKEVLIGIVAAIALVVLVPMLLRPGNETPATQQPPAPSAPPASQAPPVTETPLIQLEPPQDKGTTVLLKWSFSKPLTYAVFVAEQGAKAPRAMYRGSGTALTVQVSPGLKYCFEVQGTDGREVFYSKPRSIRDATCKS